METEKLRSGVKVTQQLSGRELRFRWTASTTKPYYLSVEGRREGKLLQTCVL